MSDRWGRRLLLCIAITACAFTAWELGGIDPRIPWHTITFMAVHNIVLNVAIAIGWLVVGIAGFVWWEWHVRQPVVKR